MVPNLKANTLVGEGGHIIGRVIDSYKPNGEFHSSLTNFSSLATCILDRVDAIGL